LFWRGRSASGGRVGEDAFEHAGGLAHLDEVAVGIAQVASYLGFSVEWFGKKLCAFGFGIGITGCAVGDPRIQKRRDRITDIRRSQCGLSGVGPPPGFMMIQLLATLTMAGFCSNALVAAVGAPPGWVGAGRPENLVQARSIEPQKQCTGLTLPAK
jgi:hypothetical protein